MRGAGQRPAASALNTSLWERDSTLQNVFVYVKDGLPGRLYPVPAEPVVLDQQQCRYVPRVLGIQVGQQLTIRNSDPLLHNVRAEGAINAAVRRRHSHPGHGGETHVRHARSHAAVQVQCPRAG